MIGGIISWLLWHANADPGFHRRDFYAMKDRLLARYGRVVGHDVQRIQQPCYGTSWDMTCKGAGCPRCGGTGIWSERWVLLERWDLAGRTFHKPVGPAHPRAVDFIDGYIRHQPRNYRASRDAQLWLALLFDWRLFRRLLTTSRMARWQWRPLLALQSIVFEVRLWTRVQRCHCGRRYFSLRTGWLICPRCRAVPVGASIDDEDLPF